MFLHLHRNLIVRIVTREGPLSAGCVTVIRGGQVTAVSVTRDCQSRRCVGQRLGTSGKMHAYTIVKINGNYYKQMYINTNTYTCTCSNY